MTHREINRNQKVCQQLIARSTISGNAGTNKKSISPLVLEACDEPLFPCGGDLVRDSRWDGLGQLLVEVAELPRLQEGVEDNQGGHAMVGHLKSSKSLVGEYSLSLCQTHTYLEGVEEEDRRNAQVLVEVLQVEGAVEDAEVEHSHHCLAGK